MKHIRLLLLLILAVMPGRIAQAALTTVWDFNTPSAYSLSDSNKIEVANGVAKLKLQIQGRYDASLADYQTNNASAASLGLGPDVTLSLGKVGGLYKTSGSFTSRVFDGGVGNLWQGLNAKAYNLTLENALNELPASTSNLLGIFHLNNTWQNIVTTSNAVPVGGATFITSARIGSHAAYFDGLNNWARTDVNVNGLTEYSMCMWVKMRKYSDYGVSGLVASRVSNLQGFFEQSGKLWYYLNQSAIISPSSIPLNQWIFLAATWQGSTKTAAVYLNGVVWMTGVLATSANVVQGESFCMATDPGIGRYCAATIDDVMFFSKALSAQEVYDLYRRPSSIMLQVRAGETIDDLAAQPFVGPAGVTNVYYVSGNQSLVLGGLLKHWGQYAQYQASFAGPADGSQTPYLDAAGLTGSRAAIFDNTLGDFISGTNDNLAVTPASLDTPYMGLAKQANGGYYTSGQFTSMPLDGGGPTLWDRIKWTIPPGLTLASDMLGLWRMEGGFGDDGLYGFNGTSMGTVTFTSQAKLGSQSAVFTGSTYAVMGSLGSNSVKALEFWMKDDNVDDGILELCNNSSNKVYLTLSGRLITPIGFARAPEVTVNGSVTSRRIGPGWNHVGIAMYAGMQVTDFSVGVANGQYMHGQMDEMAVYSRAVTPAEFKNHFVAGQRAAAGRVKFQVRSGDALPLSGTFVGPSDLAGVYFQDNTGGSASLPGSTINKRYLQYQATFAGDGISTPVFNSVVVATISSGAHTNDTAAAFLPGTFNGTAWVGDEIKLQDRPTVPGLVNMDADVDILGLWHMDESKWDVSTPVSDSSYNPNPGTAYNGATTLIPGLVGAACGQFNGVNQYVGINGIALDGDFSLMTWFKTTAGTWSAVVSRSDGKCILEINGNGAAGATGRVAFVVNNGAGNTIALASVGNLNDGAWHHVAGVRRGQTIHVYIDGMAAGSAALASAANLGGGTLYLARHGALGSYLACNEDELVVYSRALSDGEIRQVAAMDSNIKATGVYTSGIYDAGQPAIWASIAWRNNAHFGLPLTNNDASLVGLWHLDETNGTVVADASGAGNVGTLVGSATRVAGKFGQALSLAGTGGYVSIPNNFILEPASVSVEAWVKPGAVDSRVIFDKRTATTGYALGTDANGKPVFWVNGVSVISQSGLQPGLWYHVAGTYDGSTVKVFVNGDVTGVAAGTSLNTAGNEARIGLGYAGAGSLLGVVDEVTVFNRALNAEEILDQARAGAGTLSIQARVGVDTNSLMLASFVGPDGTSNTFFTADAGSSMLSSVPLGQYFQYRVILATEDGFRAPVFQGATISQTGYPVDNPWVIPNSGQLFMGKLVDFYHILYTNTDSAFRYNISGDNGTNWYAWSGSQWDNVTGFTNPASAWTWANPRATLDANIGTFYDSQYAKTGGVFKFKAYLKSDAIQQVALDEVSLLYSAGRIVVTVPNGQEVGQDAWSIGVPYNIHWVSAGVVSGTLKLEYSLNDGTSWVTIATNVPNSGVYSNWVTPAVASDLCRVRITDMNDASVTDMSDANFSLVQRFRVTVPNGGEKWYTGRVNTLRWLSAVGLGNLADLDYAADGTNFSYRIKFGAVNYPGAATNAYVWATPQGVPALLSETAKVRVQTFGGTTGADASDNYFTLAGIEVTMPPGGSLVNRRAIYPMQWVAAGASNAVAVDFSGDGGSSWTNVAASTTNVAGVNVYNWNPGVPPTDTARLRVRSLLDTNVVGVSSNFVLADVQILAPSNNVTWGMGLTNSIVWVTGGAGSNVNIYYSTNSGGQWMTVASLYPNAGGSNSYAWTVPRLPGAATRIKIESCQDVNLFAISEDFNIAGVRVAAPNGGVGEVWPKDVPNSVTWEYYAVGEGATLQFSYDGGVTYQTFGGPGVPLINRAFSYTPNYPTVRAKAKIIADYPSPFTNMMDESDAYFTVGGIQVTVPSTGTVYTLGTSGPINWVSAGADDPLGQAKLSYIASGVTNTIVSVGNNESYPGGNSYTWSLGLQTDPSPSALLMVRSGAYTGLSAPFVLRGIKFTSPVAGTVFDVGGNGALVWRLAGIDDSANGYFYLSSDGGVTFATNAINAAQIWTAISGAYPWSIDPNENPTTNALLRFVLTSSATPQDVGYQALSLPFVLRGMKFITPAAGTVWAHATTNAVTWRSARAGSLATLYYSPDGVTFDAAPVATSVSLIDGVNTYSWPVEYSRMPSTNAVLKAVAASATAVSQPFTLNGIKVTSPIATDIWALDETNRISWVGVGTTPPYTLSLMHSGTNMLTIATGVNAAYYDWVIPAGAVASNVLIRVTDGSHRGDSPLFRVVGAPTVELIAPAAGDLWKVGTTYNIIWSKGGKMNNDFHVMFSSAPYTATNDIFNGVANFNALDNTFSCPWTVPDRLGDVRIIVQHNTRADIWNFSGVFKIVPAFRIVYPNGGETNIYARKLSVVSWFTLGSQSLVDLLYSADPLHASNSWVKINTAPIPNNGQGIIETLTTYDWTTADLGGDVSTVRLRVRATDVPDAYDDSDADFSILYYRILWHVFDVATSNNLENLTVTDSSGWSQGSLTSPVEHRYPFGVFDTVWGGQYFYNNVLFKWSAEPARTINVPMTRSEVEPDYAVMANFTYDPTNAQFRVNSWLQRRGTVIPTPARCAIGIYDSSGALVAQVVSTTPDANGVFWQLLPNSMIKGNVYFAKVEIEYSGATYSSGLTFNLRVPTDTEQAQQILSALTNLQASTDRIDTNLIDLATAQAIFRATAGAKLDSLTNSAEVIKAGLTNLSLQVDLLSTQALAQLSVLTNTIGVLGSGGTNLLDLVRNLPATIGSAQREPRILTRPTTVKYGASVNILYRTLVGLSASYKVCPVGSAVPSESGVMFGGVGGIYEANLTANWGYGDYQVECLDSAASSDKMIIKVARMEVDDLALTMGDVSGQLARVEYTLTNLAFTVSNIEGLVAGTATNIYSVMNAVDQLAQLTNMIAEVSQLTNAMGQVVGLTNLIPQVAYLTNAVGSLHGLTNLFTQMNGVVAAINQLGSLTNLGPQVAQMSATLGQLVGLTNMPTQMNGVVAAINQLGGLTNLGPQVDQLVVAMGQISGLTNMASQMDGVVAAVNQLGSLTNLGPQVDLLTGAMGQIVGLTNMAGQVNTLTTTLNGMTNLNMKMDQLAGSIGQIATLTNMVGTLNSVVTAINQLGGLTNLGPQVDQLVVAMGQISGLTNMASQMNGVVAAVNQLGSITNLGPQVDQLVVAMGQISGLTNMASQMNGVVAAVNQLGSLTNLGPQVDLLTGAMGQIVGLTNMAGQVNTLTTTLNGMTNLNMKVDQLAGSIGQIATLTNMVGTLNSVVTAIGQLGGLTNLGPQVDLLTGAMGQISGLTNMASQMNGVVTAVNQLGSLTNLGPQVALLTGAMGQITGLTNLASQMNGVVTAVNQLGGLTNLGPQVDQLAVAMGQISGLTNMASQMNGVVLAVNQLGSLTNLGPQVDLLTGAMGQLGGLTNLGPQVDSLNVAIGQLGGLTNMAGQVNSMALTLNGMTNLGVQVNQLAGTMNTIFTLTNMPAQINTLMGQLGSLTNLGPQVTTLNGTIGQIMALTNLVTQVNGVATGVGGLETSVTTMSNALANLDAAIRASLSGSSNLSSVATLGASLTSISTSYSNMYTMIEEGLGAATDAAGANTVFGKIAAIEADVTKVGGQASAAAQRASGARSQANSAAGAAQRIKKNMASADQMGSVMTDVGIIRKSLEDALANLNGIPGAMSTEEMVKTVRSAQDTIRKVTGERGSAPGTGGGAGAKGEAGSLSDPKAVESLINQLSETKAMMQATRQLMDEAVNKPVVVDWLEGSK